MPLVTAKFVNFVEQMRDRCLFGADDLVYLASVFLPVGCSWSLYTAKRIGEAQMETIHSLGRSRLVSDAHGRLVFHEHDIGGCPAGNVCHFVFVDNLGVMYLDAATMIVWKPMKVHWSTEK